MRKDSIAYRLGIYMFPTCVGMNRYQVNGVIQSLYDHVPHMRGDEPPMAVSDTAMQFFPMFPTCVGMNRFTGIPCVSPEIFFMFPTCVGMNRTDGTT